MITLKEVLQGCPTVKSKKDGKDYWALLVYDFREIPTAEKVNSVTMVATDELDEVCEKYELMTDYENRVWQAKNPDNQRKNTTIEEEICRNGIVRVRAK